MLGKHVADFFLEPLPIQDHRLRRIEVAVVGAGAGPSPVPETAGWIVLAAVSAPGAGLVQVAIGGRRPRSNGAVSGRPPDVTCGAFQIEQQPAASDAEEAARAGCSTATASFLSSRVALTAAVSRTNRGCALNLSASSAWVKSANSSWICSGVSEPLSAANCAKIVRGGFDQDRPFL